MKKTILRTILLIALFGIGYAIYLWNKPQRNVEHEKGIPISANELVMAYDANEKAADSLYLNKAISVTGKVASTTLNQDSFPTITISSANAMRSINCTLNKKIALPDTGTQITIKGVCTGVLSDVTIIDAVIDKP